MRRLNFYRSIFIAFIIAGTLDMLSAVLLNYSAFAAATAKAAPSVSTSVFTNAHLTLIAICKYIASGVYGKSAFIAGDKMIWLGLLFHYLIAYVWVATWFILFPTFKKFLKNTIVTGVVFGLITWLIMNLLVVPMSNRPVPKHGMTVYGATTNILALVICIGIPVALLANKYYFGKKTD